MPIVDSGELRRNGSHVHDSQVYIERVEDEAGRELDIAVLSLPHDGSWTPDQDLYELVLKSGATYSARFLREEPDPLGLNAQKAIFIVN